MQPAITIDLRPMRSESQPNTMKNGVPIARAAAMIRFAEVASTCRTRSKKNNA